jgi:phosphatidylglycerol:prolipoprotein diacylglycerol transferase
MQPVLFEIAGRPVGSYGALLFLAFVAAGVVVWLECRRRGWDVVDIPEFILLAAVGGLAGAWVYGALLNGIPASGPADVGLVFYGGLLGGTLVVVANVLRRGYPFPEASDIAALAIPPAYALGRVGCFLNGDDYGVATGVPWGMAFPEGAPPIDTPVHPTQLYESTAAVAIFAILWARRGRPAPAGSLAFEAMALLGTERLVVELWRRNPDLALGLTAAQWISLGLIAAGAAGRIWLARRPAARGGRPGRGRVRSSRA